MKLIRKTDTVARLGGDEFTIVLEGLTDAPRAAEVVAKKIVNAIRVPFLLNDKEVIVTTSIGIAVHCSGEVKGENLLSCADHAMYKAKNDGKNCWFIDV